MMSSLNTEMERHVIDFRAFLQAKNKEESTVKMYIVEIRYFLNSLQTQGKSISQTTQEDIIGAKNRMFEKGMKPSTINKSISILSSFFKWAIEQGLVTKNPAEHIRLLEPKKMNQLKLLTDEQQQSLLRYVAMERNPFKKARNEALIYVMLFAGLRVEEVSE